MFGVQEDRIPRAAKSRANPAPIPRLAPVMTAVRPLRFGRATRQPAGSAGARPAWPWPSGPWLKSLSFWKMRNPNSGVIARM